MKNTSTVCICVDVSIILRLNLFYAIFRNTRYISKELEQLFFLKLCTRYIFFLNCEYVIRIVIYANNGDTFVIYFFISIKNFAVIFGEINE